MFVISDNIMSIAGKGAVNKLVVINVSFDKSQLKEGLNFLDIRKYYQKI